MIYLVVLFALFLIVAILWDAFETIVLPRRISRSIRLSRLFLYTSSRIWLAIGRRIGDNRRRENFLGIYGPLTLIMLLAIWALNLVLGFALLEWGLGSLLETSGRMPTFLTDLYLSGSSLFSSTPSDVVLSSGLARLTVVIESGIGLGFLALVITYLPVLYQDFSRRETRISMLDEWAGSPPTATELLLRLGRGNQLAELNSFLPDWELWAAELLESYISYPVLAFFRSQHEGQSWLSALTLILDTCALVLVGIDSVPSTAARRTFAMARHALVDLSQIFQTPPRAPAVDRLPADKLAELRQEFAQAGLHLREGPDADQKLSHLRQWYEPYANALADVLLLTLPPWRHPPDARDNWQTSAFESPDGAHF